MEHFHMVFGDILTNHYFFDVLAEGICKVNKPAVHVRYSVLYTGTPRFQKVCIEFF